MQEDQPLPDTEINPVDDPELALPEPSQLAPSPKAIRFQRKSPSPQQIVAPRARVVLLSHDTCPDFSVLTPCRRFSRNDSVTAADSSRKMAPTCPWKFGVRSRSQRGKHLGRLTKSLSSSLYHLEIFQRRSTVALACVSGCSNRTCHVWTPKLGARTFCHPMKRRRGQFITATDGEIPKERERRGPS